MNEEIKDEITMEETNADVEQSSTVDYIDIEEPEVAVIEIEESIGFANGDGNITHAGLPDKDEPNQHTIESITNLRSELNKLGSAKDTYSIHGGYAEFQEWKSDGIYKKEVYRENDDGDDISYVGTGGVGFFVSLVQETGVINGGNLRIDICKKVNNDNTIEVADVYGVTVDNSGFCGNQNAEYNLLNPQSPNKNNPNYAKVCLLGNVKVRVSAEEHLKINIGDYVIPNDIGYAKKSENNMGFKVVSKGQIESVGSATTAWYYVSIALVPQNDNIARVMEEVEKTKGSLENVNIQLGEISGTMNEMYDINIGISNKFDNIQDIVNKGKIEVEQQLEVAQAVATRAQEIADEADKTMNKVSLEYSEALSKANNAHEALYGEGGVLNDIKGLQEDMQPLAEWQGEDGSKGVAGFVAQADENKTQLATLTSVFGKSGSELTAIIQKIDENGAAIQHLVTHVDKYILGEQSPAEGLAINQTGFIQPGTIYVPTKDHTEEYTYGEEIVVCEFVSQATDTEGNSLGYGQSYIWAATENKPYEYMWKIYRNVSLSTEKFDGESDGDLWYCWQGILFNDKYLYNPGVLYCWNASKKVWVPVASIGDSATSIGSVNQTAKYWQVTYTDLQDKMASLQVSVDGISGTVENLSKETMSAVNQTAEKIMMGVYDTDDGNATSLGLLLGGMTSTSTKANIVKVKEVLESAPNVYKYKNAPIWNGTEFVMSGEPSTDGKYYFDPEDTAPFTYYCEAANGKYYVYGINNTAMANLSTRVTNTESEVESWTRFQKGQNETMTSINQTSDEAGAAISSMVYGDFRECVEIKLELTDEDKIDLSAQTYAEQPKWENEFVFEGNAVSNGEYCLSATDNTVYYKLLYRDGEIIGYEKYQMKSSPYSAIVQKVEDGTSSVGLVSGNDDKIGSLFVNVINDKSEVAINADKISIHGTTTFRDILNPGTTTISGNYIRSGILVSNNYSGPAVYKAYGLSIQGNPDGGVQLYATNDSSDVIYYAIITKGVHYNVQTSSDNDTCFIASAIAPGEFVDVISFSESFAPSPYSGYLIAQHNFDCIPVDDSITGTKFDLNDGTIFSRNLILDTNGNLSISGKITATSGYIGNANGGFTIDNLSRYTYDITSPLSAGDYYFEVDGQYYSFVLEGDLLEGNEIIFTPSDLKIQVSGVQTVTLEATIEDKKPSDCERLNFKNASHYYLTNGQSILKGSETLGTPGVYIAPDGIGLGNGRFWVDKEGNVRLSGTITWGNNTSPKDAEALANSYADSKVNSLADGTYPGGTFIDRNMIKSGLFFATGEGAQYNYESDDWVNQAAYYICNGLYTQDDVDNNLIGENGIGRPKVVGWISYDSNGENTLYEAEKRIIMTTSEGTAMKIQTYCISDQPTPINLSIGAGMHRDNKTYSSYGYVYMASPVIFSGGNQAQNTLNEADVQFGTGSDKKCKVDFTYADVVGLGIDTYAKFAPDPD